ncbi:hypothetical protein CVT26_010690 [Gymnopilus dilepis]|uniref:Uncharacterized protein n=1 Tax=Gymnopilus dilepis TaxID=231916 RepID=A0A409Y0T1_9AGAR|nr:hypothetical protein CVT26_010690 [Gymnopilus dilepis]
MAPTMVSPFKNKVGRDGLSKQQRYLSNPENYRKVLERNRERNKKMRQRKKEAASSPDSENTKGQRARRTGKDLTLRYQTFLNLVFNATMLGGWAVTYLETTSLTDFRDLPEDIAREEKRLTDLMDDGRRLLRVLSRDVDRHQVMWDKVLDQILGLYGIYKQIGVGKQKLRTAEDLRALDELDDDLARLEALEREEEDMEREGEEEDPEQRWHPLSGIELPFLSDSDD